MELFDVFVELRPQVSQSNLVNLFQTCPLVNVYDNDRVVTIARLIDRSSRNKNKQGTYYIKS